MELDTFNISWLGFFVVAFYIVVVAYIAVHRIYLSPLSHIPGSKVAIATNWYECYYDVWKSGLYYRKIREMHQTYGPIIRINSTEVHIQDSEYYDEIFNNNQRWDKYWLNANKFNAPHSTISTVDHDLHRMRRKPQNAFFSKRSVVALEPVIRAKLEQLCILLNSAKETQTPFRVNAAMLALTTDVIQEYAFGESQELLRVGKDEDRVLMARTIKVAGRSAHLLKHWPWFMHILDVVPASLIARIDPGLGMVLKAQAGIRAKVTRVHEEKDNKLDRDSIFHALLHSDLPPEEKTIDRLTREGWIVAGAGGDTAANALSTMLYYLLANPPKLARLRKELSTTPLPFTWTALEQLPYLNAIICETLRLQSTAGRSPRCAPDRELVYRKFTIPRNTPVSMNAIDVHEDPAIFPNPKLFFPERWLHDDSTAGKAQSARMHRFLVPFGKGSRQCTGLNLAYAEMYISIATLVTRFDFELYETTIEDVEFQHDWTLPFPKIDSELVRVMVK